MTQTPDEKTVTKLEVQMKYLTESVEKLEKNLPRMFKDAITNHTLECINRKQSQGGSKGFFSSMTAAQRTTFISMVMGLGVAVTALIKSYVG